MLSNFITFEIECLAMTLYSKFGCGHKIHSNLCRRVKLMNLARAGNEFFFGEFCRVGTFFCADKCIEHVNCSCPGPCGRIRYFTRSQMTRQTRADRVQFRIASKNVHYTKTKYELFFPFFFHSTGMGIKWDFFRSYFYEFFRQIFFFLQFVLFCIHMKRSGRYHKALWWEDICSALVPFNLNLDIALTTTTKKKKSMKKYAPKLNGKYNGQWRVCFGSFPSLMRIEEKMILQAVYEIFYLLANHKIFKESEFGLWTVDGGCGNAKRKRNES